MKKLFILILSALIFIPVLAQEPITFFKVIQTDSVGKEALFAVINEWFASTYNSANDVIQMNDKQAGTIIGRGSVDYYCQDVFSRCYDGYLEYTIKAFVKDNRYKVELTNFTHKNFPDLAKVCSLGVVTDAPIYTDKWPGKKYDNAVWDDLKIKASAISDHLIKSIENKTNNLATKEKDDW
jgi:hypothetical protein